MFPIGVAAVVLTIYTDWLISIANRRAFWLKSDFKNQGLDIRGVSVIFFPIIVSRIAYALPAFYVCLTEVISIE